MRIIDILNKMAERTLEDGFKFKYNEYIYTYDEDYDNAFNEYNSCLSEDITIEKYLNDEVKVIEDVKEIEPFKTEYTMRAMDIEFKNKINELVQAVNELRKKE